MCVCAHVCPLTHFRIPLSQYGHRRVAADWCRPALHACFLCVVPDVTYVVDLSNERTMSLTIEPRPVKLGRRFVPGCFVCLESRTCSTNLTLAPGSKHKISFLCDDLTRLWMNAEKTIGTPCGGCPPPGPWAPLPFLPCLLGGVGCNWYDQKCPPQCRVSKGNQEAKHEAETRLPWDQQLQLEHASFGRAVCDPHPRSHVSPPRGRHDL